MSQIYTIPCNRNEDVFIHAIPGHYVTASAHLNYYVGTSDIKHNRVVSVEAAKLLAEYYSVRNMDVDTVLCLYETQALGAYMAQELASPSMLAPNPDLQVYVLGPEYDTQGNMIFRDNLRRMIQGKNVVVLISCITSGRTVWAGGQHPVYPGGSAQLFLYSCQGLPHVQGRSAGRRHYERLRLLQTVKFGLTKSARVL